MRYEVVPGKLTELFKHCPETLLVLNVDTSVSKNVQMESSTLTATFGIVTKDIEMVKDTAVLCQ